MQENDYKNQKRQCYNFNEGSKSNSSEKTSIEQVRPSLDLSHARSTLISGSAPCQNVVSCNKHISDLIDSQTIRETYEY